MNQSLPWHFNQADAERWSYNFVRFVVMPTTIAFLVAYQGALNWHIAWGIAIGTLYTSLIDFLTKLKNGSP